MPSLVLMVPAPKEPEIFSPCHLSPLNASAWHMTPQSICLQVPARLAIDIWLGWPLHHLAALGWATSFVPPMPDGVGDLLIQVNPRPDKVSITAEGLRNALLQVLLAARIQCVHQQSHHCEVQFVQVRLAECEVWSGRLPADFRVELLLSWWRDIASLTGMEVQAKIVSGTLPVPSAVTAAELVSRRSSPRLLHSGHLVLPVCPGLPSQGDSHALLPNTLCQRNILPSSTPRARSPSTPGPMVHSLRDVQVPLPFYATARIGEASHPGPAQATGNKEENRQWAMTKLATLALTLTQGIDLANTTTFVNSMLEAVGAPKLVSLLNDTPETSRWDAISEMAQTKEVPVPVIRNGYAKAESQAKKTAQRMPLSTAASELPTSDQTLNFL